MDKPAKRLTRERQFRVRVPIGAIFTRHIGDESGIHTTRVYHPILQEWLSSPDAITAT